MHDFDEIVLVLDARAIALLYRQRQEERAVDCLTL
jgi:hypothetical protein